MDTCCQVAWYPLPSTRPLGYFSLMRMQLQPERCTTSRETCTKFHDRVVSKSIGGHGSEK